VATDRSFVVALSADLMCCAHFIQRRTSRNQELAARTFAEANHFPADLHLTKLGYLTPRSAFRKVSARASACAGYAAWQSRRRHLSEPIVKN